MFKIEDNKIHITRGDTGIIILSIPERDLSGYIKYQDTNNVIYWYDNDNNILYDNNYNISSVLLSTLTIVLHQFSIGDIIKFTVYDENALDSTPLINKSVTVSTAGSYVNIPLTSNDTKIGDYVNEKVKYWYQIELNGEQTIVGYDNNGPKILILYPEGVDI